MVSGLLQKFLRNVYQEEKGFPYLEKIWNNDANEQMFASEKLGVSYFEVDDL